MGGVLIFVNSHTPQPAIPNHNTLSNKNIETQLHSASLKQIKTKKRKKFVQTPSRRMNSSLRAGSSANAPT